MYKKDSGGTLGSLTLNITGDLSLENLEQGILSIYRNDSYIGEAYVYPNLFENNKLNYSIINEYQMGTVTILPRDTIEFLMRFGTGYEIDDGGGSIISQTSNISNISFSHSLSTVRISFTVTDNTTEEALSANLWYEAGSI